MKRSTASNIGRLALEARYVVLHQIAKLFQNLRPLFRDESGCVPRMRTKLKRVRKPFDFLPNVPSMTSRIALSRRVRGPAPSGLDILTRSD